jgi:SPP1 gp7 family putative phage head morphogenesis protein
MPAGAEFRQARARFARARRAEFGYARLLRGIAFHIDRLVKGFDYEDDDAVSELERVLYDYADAIEPWARSVGRRMIEEVAARDARAWFEAGREINRSLRAEIASAPIGVIFHQALADQVNLIQSLPLDAATRVQTLATNAYIGGKRAVDVVDEIMKTGDIARHRATTIARTEVSRVATELTATRAKYIGSEGAIWRTSKDKDVRKEHRHLEGKYFKWTEPPVAGHNNERYLPGAGPNCRCYPEVIIPDYYSRRK